MNLTLSVSQEIANQARNLAARNGKSLSAWFREKIEAEPEAIRLEEIRAIDPETADMVGAALPLEEHWEDARWRALAEKHLR
ncbi:MAG: hypothetical protein PHD76_09265 [Methylacidiphilales bacterium]|nr:hypothetical protein [Candidatus Methylacidiphilales bacterium]